MKNFKEKLYNYESSPPNDIWDKIITELDSKDKEVVQIPVFRKKSKFIFYGLTAAASLLIIFISSLVFNRNNKNNKPLASLTIQNKDSATKELKDSLNNKTLAYIIKSSKNKSFFEAYNLNNNEKKYITIAGHDGQPVRISSKVATLIVSADNDYPPKAVWDKKINKWKELMLSSRLSMTATNLLEIAQLSSVRGDN
ncbi:MAG: hypothetical protein ABIO81_07700 [Ginsengibacter sp.]